MLVVFMWVVATIGVTYVANAAVELVDLQVFPQGARIEVLARVTPTTTVAPVATTPVAPVATTTVAPVATTTVATTTVAPVATTPVAPVATTTVAPVATTPVATTTVAPVATTTVATTTVAPVVTTTVAPVVTTTVAPVVTTTVAPVVTTTVATTPVALVMADPVLDNGRTGFVYRTRLAMDGAAPFFWKVESGLVPAGLLLTDDGYLEGTPTGSGRYVFTATATDGSGRSGTRDYAIVVREFRVISARGGSVTVIVQGNSVAFFSALQGEGFDQAVLVRNGPIVVEVQFLPSGGDETSWVRCEAEDGVVCSHG